MPPLGRSLSAPLCLLALVALALLAAGCGHKEETTPVACLEGSKPYLKALEAAPGEVLVRGEATIADCLPENQDPGDLATVGEAMIEAATALNAEAREAGGTQQATELGYLVGAVQKRSTETDGVHTELARHLVVSARFAPDKQPLSGRFHEAYETGFAAAGEG
jgi:hypothetical protein